MNEEMDVKFGHIVEEAEAETLAYLLENTDIPVPKVCAEFSEPVTTETSLGWNIFLA